MLRPTENALDQVFYLPEQVAEIASINSREQLCVAASAVSQRSSLVFRGCMNSLQTPNDFCVYSSQLLHLQNVTHCAEVFGSVSIQVLFCSESRRMTGMFPTRGCQRYRSGSVLRCLQSVPHAASAHALLGCSASVSKNENPGLEEAPLWAGCVQD